MALMRGTPCSGCAARAARPCRGEPWSRSWSACRAGCARRSSRTHRPGEECRRSRWRCPAWPEGASSSPSCSAVRGGRFVRSMSCSTVFLLIASPFRPVGRAGRDDADDLHGLLDAIFGSCRRAAGREACYAAAWLTCLPRASARQPPPGRNAGWAAAAGFPVIPTHENRAFPLSVTGTTGAAWHFRGARPSRPQFRAAHCLVAMPGILAPLGPSESGVAPPPGTPSFASISMKARRSSAVR